MPCFTATAYPSSIKFYYASVVREKQPGQAARLRDLYLEAGESLIVEGRHDDLVSYLGMAANEFNRICRDTECPKVCVVGEIFLKFNPFAQKNVTDWLISQGVEIVPPLLLDFFMQSFVNRRADEAAHLRRRSVSDFAYTLAYRRIMKHIDRVNRAAAAFSRFTPFADIFAEAEEARKVITLSAQFGEGWLLPAEIMSCARQGVRSVVSLQPFGCIANHARLRQRRERRQHNQPTAAIHRQPEGGECHARKPLTISMFAKGRVLRCETRPFAL